MSMKTRLLLIALLVSISVSGQVNSENAILNNLDGLIFRAGVGTTSLYVGCGILFN